MQYVFEYKFNICINVGIISWQLVCYYLCSFALNVLMMQQQHINKNNTTAPMRMQQSLSCWIKPENNHSNWRCLKTNSGSVKYFFLFNRSVFWHDFYCQYRIFRLILILSGFFYSARFLSVRFCPCQFFIIVWSFVLSICFFCLSVSVPVNFL